MIRFLFFPLTFSCPSEELSHIETHIIDILHMQSVLELKNVFYQRNVYKFGKIKECKWLSLVNNSIT